MDDVNHTSLSLSSSSYSSSQKRSTCDEDNIINGNSNGNGNRNGDTVGTDTTGVIDVDPVAVKAKRKNKTTERNALDNSMMNVAKKSKSEKKKKKNAFEILMNAAKIPGMFAFELLPQPIITDDQDTANYYEKSDSDIEERLLFLDPVNVVGWGRRILVRYQSQFDPILISAINEICHPIASEIADKAVKDFYNRHAHPTVLGTMTPDNFAPSSATFAAESSPNVEAHIVKLTVCFNSLDVDDIEEPDKYKKHYDKFNHEGRPRSHTMECSDYYGDEHYSSSYSGKYPEYGEDVQTDDPRQILGFIVTYSDGTEIELGNLRGTAHEATLLLPTENPIQSIHPGKRDYDSMGNEQFTRLSQYRDDYHSEKEEEDKEYDNHTIHCLFVEISGGMYFIFAGGLVTINSGGGTQHPDSNSLVKENTAFKNLSKLVRSSNRIICMKNTRSYIVPTIHNNDVQPKIAPHTRQRRFDNVSSRYQTIQEERQYLIELFSSEYSQGINRICDSVTTDLLKWYLTSTIPGVPNSKRITNVRLLEMHEGMLQYEESQDKSLTRKKKKGLAYKRRRRMAEETTCILAISNKAEADEILRRKSKLISGVLFYLSKHKQEFRFKPIRIQKYIDTRIIDTIRQFNNKLITTTTTAVTATTTCLHSTEQPELERVSICSACSTLYQPAYVRSRKRCSFEGCWNHRHCGCQVWECHDCLTPFCDSHRNNDHDCSNRKCNFNDAHEGNDNSDSDSHSPPSLAKACRKHELKRREQEREMEMEENDSDDSSYYASSRSTGVSDDESSTKIFVEAVDKEDEESSEEQQSDQSSSSTEEEYETTAAKERNTHKSAINYDT